jgi:nitrous oxide reductase accessory protein NosL
MLKGKKSASKAACFDEEHAAERGAKRRGGVKVHERRKGFLNKAPTDMHQKP